MILDGLCNIVLSREFLLQLLHISSGRETEEEEEGREHAGPAGRHFLLLSSIKQLSQDRKNPTRTETAASSSPCLLCKLCM